jgi:hypothetical protein
MERAEMSFPGFESLTRFKFKASACIVKAVKKRDRVWNGNNALNVQITTLFKVHFEI